MACRRPPISNRYSTLNRVRHSRPAGWTTCLTQIAAGPSSPSRKIGCALVHSSTPGHPVTIARYSFSTSRRSKMMPSSRAARVCLATKTSPLVSRSKRFTIAGFAPFSISNANKRSIPPSKVGSGLRLAGCTIKGAGLSTTSQSADSSTTAKSTTTSKLTQPSHTSQPHGATSCCPKAPCISDKKNARNPRLRISGI